MSPSDLVPDGISTSRLVVLLVILLLEGALLWFGWQELTPALAAFFLLAITYFVASIFDAVRAHPLFDLGSALWTTALFALWYLVDAVTFAGILAVLAALGAIVEGYNYWKGTSYLRLDV